LDAWARVLGVVNLMLSSLAQRQSLINC